jgi:hypothetical protein
VETFVVRVWTPAESEGTGPRGLRGLVERVRAGERRPFDGEEELLAVLRSAVGQEEEGEPDEA